MRWIRWLPIALTLAVLPARGERIPVAVSARSGEVERTAAAELAAFLAATYPNDLFEVVTGAPKAGKAILVGTPGSFPELARLVPKSSLRGPESFAVSSATRNGAAVGVVAGADPRGALFGVYALLEKLGWGFYLSYDAAPAPRREPCGFAEWKLADAPVFADRVVFNWHNFLSSASTWEFEDWQRWIRGAARMRYNTVMIHAYGNNPMFSFRHNGQAKPVGYLSTTRTGRDWGTQHVSDVRRLWGGQIFTAPVFGSSAAVPADAERTAAAQALTHKALACARRYGLHVTFALDVDTESANPQNVILTLPASARFRSGALQLANPDTPEGYAYWKAQIAQLLAAYPQIDRLVVWFRHGATPWRGLKPEDFPPAWKTRYERMLGEHPAMRTHKDAPSMFAIGRIASAFARALGELGRKDVELGNGTWLHDHLPAAGVFFEPGVKFYWLDTKTIFDRPETQAALRAIPRGRPMLPVVWAHHDDRTYIGRPYTPFAKFASLVEGAGTGFGIIHWTTRPLDLYFKSLGEQVWNATRNRPLEETTLEMAARSFGPSVAAAGGEYLLKWVTEGRMFGRETTDRFIDVPLADAAEVVARCRARLGLLARIDETALPAEGGARLGYFREYEEFTAAFFTAHAAFERAQDLHQRGETAAARAALAECDPGSVIGRYVQAASLGGMTRGEQALIISLNLRWLPYVVSLRQALGMELARFRFGPTQHEPLAQGAGRNTFEFDGRRALWKVLGEKETGAAAVAEPGGGCSSGIRIERPLTLKLAGIMGDALSAGRYRAQAVLREGAGAAVIQWRDPSSGAAATGAAANLQLTGGAVQLTVHPKGGAVTLCAATLAGETTRP